MGARQSHRVGRGVRYFSLLTLAIGECLFISMMLLGSIGTAQASTIPAPSARYVVADQAGTNSALAASDVSGVGGVVDEPLDAADAVLADLTPSQVSQLQTIPTVTVTQDESFSMSSVNTPTAGVGQSPAAVFPQQTGATQLWSQGDSGTGVNVAVLDTGIDPLADFAGRLLPGVDLSGEGNPYQDSYGHGTFVAGLIAGNGASSNGLYKGEAPGAGLVSVKVAGADGETDLATVIAGVGWVIAHHVSENIDVLNMSLGATPLESTLLDPLDQAVERAWQAGIVVVVSAGNGGPFNGTILSPGDDPLVITVGALNDQGSVSSSGDTMASFSAVGPTNPDGWIKPDLVTSGQSVVSLRAPGSTIDVQNPSGRIGSGNFVGSGTSFSSAITSGSAALLLADHLKDQPDDVKAALLGAAAPGPVGNPLVDGHGMLNVAAANAAGGLHLDQESGQVSLTQGPLGGNTTISPGTVVNAGYSVQMSGQHRAASLELVAGQLDVPVTCASNGPLAGFLPVDLATTPYQIPANSSTSLPPGGPGSMTFQGSAVAPDLCDGGPMYPTQPSVAPVSFTGSLVSNDISDPVQVRFTYGVGSQTSGGGPTATVTPVSIPQMSDTIDLGTTWSDSTWNPANWSGAHWSAGQWNSASWNAASWSGSDWNGATWTGAAWNGAHWSGSTWNGAHWSGAAWDGSAWDGSAWEGAHWSGAHWSGGAWGTDSDAGSQPSAPSVGSGSSAYPGYQLVSSNPDLWCPTGSNLGHSGNSGSAGNQNGGAGGSGGPPGCGSNGGNGGNGGNGDANGGLGGPAGSGGAGGCPPSTDAQMATGQFPCNGNGASGGNGGKGGNSQSGINGGPGGPGGNGGDAQGAQGGAGGNGGSAQSGLVGGVGGTGGTGGGCLIYNASYWVSCASSGGHGGQGGGGAAGAPGGNGGNGGSAGTAQNANGGNAGTGGNAATSGSGTDGQAGGSGGVLSGEQGANGQNGANGQSPPGG